MNNKQNRVDVQFGQFGIHIDWAEQSIESLQRSILVGGRHGVWGPKRGQGILTDGQIKIRKRLQKKLANRKRKRLQ
jgi:hypothetical protein